MNEKRRNAVIEVSGVWGRVGLSLLLDVLSWDPETISPSAFKKREYQRQLIDLVAAPLNPIEAEHISQSIKRGDLDEQPSWRNNLRRAQDELRGDLLAILKPKSFLTPPGASAKSVCIAQLFRKMFGFHWQQGLFLGGGGKTNGLESSTSFEIGGERFLCFEGIAFHGSGLGERYLGFLQRLYWILYSAFKTNEISKLRHCDNDRCGKFFLGKRPQCSETCRSAVNNKSRRKYHKKRYKTQRTNKIEKAKRLLNRQTKIAEVIRLTGLTYKALERAKLVKPAAGEM
jgi:hypothetical protein